MTRRLFLLLLWLLTAAAGLQAQTDSAAIDQLRQRRGHLQQRIARSEALLKTTSDDTRSQLEALGLLNAQVEERRLYIRALNLELDSLDRALRRLEQRIDRLKKELKEKQDRYAASVRYLQSHRSTIQEKLLFIFSADNLRQMYRRLRYVRQYADYQRRRGEEIGRQRRQIDRQHAEMLRLRQSKGALLKDRRQEMLALQQKELEKEQLVKTLQRKQRDLQRELSRQRREAEQLNARIDRLVAEEIEKARQRALAEERRRKQQAERRRKQQQADGGQEKAQQEADTSPADEKQYVTDRSDQRLTGSFASNRGRLPVPITGPYVLSSHYGRYSVMRNVVLDNKGIDLQGQPGARARAVFDGRVAAVFQLNGLWNILVRHGDYISVYCNLSAAQVKPGDEVKARQPLGEVFSDGTDGGRTVLHFQLRREKQKLNPEQWLAL